MYCDFCSFPAGESDVLSYCKALEKEIDLSAALWGGMPVSTAYIGGGTPSIVPFSGIERVITRLRERFDVAPNAEFTCEANPGTLTSQWLDGARALGVNRLSLGAQAAQDGLLRALGRIHCSRDIELSFEAARARGFDNINLDIMYGLPGQTARDYAETLDMFTALRPEHISAYSLILEEGTPLKAAVDAGGLALPGEEELAGMDALSVETLDGAGYRRYEISNYALPGRECAHNIGYWRGAYYLGLGLAAHGMLPCESGAYSRHANTTSMESYMRQVNSGALPRQSVERVPKESAMFEFMMLGLRMVDGVDEREFSQRFGKTVCEAYGEKLDWLTANGLLTRNGRVALTPRGLDVQSSVLLKLMN